MVEDVGHLTIEPSAHAFGDLGGLGNAEVDVPAVVAANEAAPVPAADDLVQRATSRREVLSAAKRQIVGHERGEGMAPVKLSRAVVAVQVESIGSFVEALLVLTNLIEGMRQCVIEVKR